MENTEVQHLQQLLFRRIKENLPCHLSLAEEVASILQISTDSAYRRIRAEKTISLAEARILCLHFRISVDQLFFNNTESILFSGSAHAGIQQLTFDLFLNAVLNQLQYLNSFEEREFTIMPKDISFFYLFYFKELAAFKLFFWMKTLLQCPLYSECLYTMEHYTELMQQTGEKIVREYNMLPSQEIWHKDNLRTTVRQIEYYKDAKMFGSAQEIVNLYDCLEKLVNHVERQAEHGYKFPACDGEAARPGAPLKLFLNEYVLGDNSSLAVLNNKLKIVYLNYSVLNSIRTTDANFVGYFEQCLQNHLRKSVLVSRVGEKERAVFFYDMRKEIQERRDAAGDYRPNGNRMARVSR
jgi:hypothetical protein